MLVRKYHRRRTPRSAMSLWMPSSKVKVQTVVELVLALVSVGLVWAARPGRGVEVMLGLVWAALVLQTAWLLPALDAETALRTGFAQRSGDLGDALAWAAEVAELAPLSVAGQKLALDRLSGRTVADDDVGEAFDRVWRSDDRLEGIRAFQEKRPPRFRGR